MIDRATIHGLSRTKEYKAWQKMKDRCFNENNSHYEGYGGRGITVCSRWMDFENFYKDMGECPEGCSIDRIDNDSSYMPSNCRWATTSQQMNNTRRNVVIQFNGESLTVAQWENRLGINKGTAYHRLRRGWSIERALTTPPCRKVASP
jgi:hypothetical protein